MIFLDNANRSLQITLGSAITTSNSPFVASYVDLNQISFAASAAAANTGASNGTSVVAVVAAPNSGTTRQLKYFSFFNADTVATTVTVTYNDNSTLRKLITVTLQIGEKLDYNGEKNWITYDANGNIKQVFSYPNESANTVLAGPTSGSAAFPSFRALVGADLPNPSATTLGGIESLVAVTSKWINAISTSGVPSATQPATTDLSDITIAPWTPADASGASLTFTSPAGIYIKIGKLVFVSFTYTMPSTSNTNQAASTLPFTSTSGQLQGLYMFKNTSSSAAGVDISSSSGGCFYPALPNTGGGGYANVTLSGASLGIAGVYQSA